MLWEYTGDPIDLPGRGWTLQHHRRRTRIVVDDFGTAVGYERRCALCRNWYPLNHTRFSLRANDPLGLSPRCKHCDAFDQRTRHVQGGEKRRGKCERCGKPKIPGRGQRLCVDCAPVATRKPCGKCGSTAPKLPGQRWCPDCRDTQHWQAERREKARKAMKRKVCRGCGKPKGAGVRRIFCDACAKERELPRPCTRCGERNERRPKAQICEVCRAQADVVRRETKRAWDAAHPDRPRRKKAKPMTKRQRTQRAEGRRILYRLKLEQAGKSTQRNVPARLGAGHRANWISALPVAPLADAVRARVSDGDLTAFSEKAGVSDRSIREMRSGGRQDIQMDTAERLLMALDLLWFDVWTPDGDPEAYRRAALAFEGDDQQIAA